MHVAPNSGIMGDDTLDRLRASALLAQHDAPLPEDVVHYLRALEQRYVDGLAEQRKKSLREIGWKLQLVSLEPRP